MISTAPVHFKEELHVGARSIFSRETNGEPVVPGKINHLERLFEHGLSGLMVLVPYMPIRGGYEDAHHVHITVNCRLDIPFTRPCQAADPGIKPHPCNRLYTLSLIGRYNGEPGFDHFHPDLIEF